MEYPIALALEDFVPVVLGTTGFALLARTARICLRNARAWPEPC